jgi:transmembrane sensor
MNRTTSNDPAAEEQASLWAARLEGSSLSAADRAGLADWLAGDPARPALLARYRDLSADLDVVVPELAAAGRVALPPRRAAPATWNPWKIGAAGLSVAALAAAALVWHGRSAPRAESISSPTGERRTFTLADGSQVELNANTSVTVDNGPGERRVHLANGEAFFEVSKDQSRPFIVETPAGSVRVTGTKFNVLTEASSQLEVTVVEGSVQVRPGDAQATLEGSPYVLHHGDSLTAEAGGVGLHALAAGDLEDALAWRQGQIVCLDMPLATALGRFAHYHGIAISATPTVAGRSLGGRYSLGDLDGFLGQVAASLKVKVSHLPDGSIRVSLPTEP